MFRTGPRFLVLGTERLNWRCGRKIAALRCVALREQSRAAECFGWSLERARLLLVVRSAPAIDRMVVGPLEVRQMLEVVGSIG